jgi:hypothetical protein
MARKREIIAQAKRKLRKIIIPTNFDFQVKPIQKTA